MLQEIYGYAEGIDPSSRLTSFGRYNNVKCTPMVAENLRYDDETFSLVVAKDVLEHCTDPDKALEECYRVLADGGYFLAMIPLDGEPSGFDDISVHPAHAYDNASHIWKATDMGVLRRIFGLGLTDVQVHMYHHSQLFGEVRSFGDRVIVVRGKKQNDVIKLPIQYFLGNAYWSAFLTFNCTGNCWYCIQHACKDEFIQARSAYEKNKLSGEEWVAFYDKLQRWRGNKLGIIGGEPTLHKDFFDIVNGTTGYYKTITTNMSTPEILRFGDMIEDKVNLRVNTSYHPHLMSADEFCNRIHLLRSQGFFVEQVAVVDTPTTDYRKIHTELLSRGVASSPQTFMGMLNGEMFPQPDSSIAEDHGETGIRDWPLFDQGFSCKGKQQVVCSSGRFLVAPDGGIYRCHYQLYSKTDPQGDVRTGEFPIEQDYRLCDDYGFCNPCDFAHVSFKTVMANLHEILVAVTENEDVAHEVGQALTHFNQTPEFQELFNNVFNTLYSSTEPWWELYNNKNLHKYINDFICEGSIVFNDKTDYIAAFEYLLYRRLPFGVNLHRILNDEAMVKYLALVSAIHSEVLKDHPTVVEYFAEDGSLMSSLIAKMLATFGTTTAYEDLYVAKKIKEEETNEEA
jgi:SAM-dependent methyltransferase